MPILKLKTKDLIKKSDLCITHNGSILLEAVYYNKKTIVLGNTPYFDKNFHFNITSFNHFYSSLKTKSFFTSNFLNSKKNSFFNNYLSKLIYGNASELSKNISDKKVLILWNNLKEFI